MRGRHRRPAPRGRWLAASALLVLVVAGAVGAGLSLSSGGTATSTPTSPSPSTASPSPTTPSTSAPPTTPPASATRTPSPTPRPATPLVLRVIGSASYVKVSVPGGPVVLETILHRGQSASFKQPSLDLVLGDAGAVRISVYGKTTSPAGRPGQVLRLAIRPPR